MARAIDLNADLGEGCPWDNALLGLVSSASISCGAHAGTTAEIDRTLRQAALRGVIVGAHPGYADRVGFGRVDQDLPDEQIRSLMSNQLADLTDRAKQIGVPVRFVKPHGALYNQGQRDSRIAEAIVAALVGRDLPILGQPGGAVERAAQAAGVRFVAEGFADRSYRPDGALVPRTEPGAILDQPELIRAQVLDLVDRGVETLCVHGDNPGSVALAELVRATLDSAGIEVRGFA